MHATSSGMLRPSIAIPLRGPWSLASLLVATIAALSTAVIYAAVLARIASNAYGATGDFLSFYAAGWLVRTGRGASLYDPATTEWAQRLLFPGDFERAIGYPLPVFVAWIFAPFSALPFTVAFFLWMAVGAVLLGIVIWSLASEFQGAPRSFRLVFVLCSALALPTLAAIVFGQVDPLVLAAVVAGYRLWHSGRSLAAGAVLAVGAVKPHLLAGVMLLFVVRRDWKALASLGSLTALLLIVPALLTSPGALAGNLRLLMSYPSADDQLAVNAEVMPNWRGFVVSLTGRSEVALWLPGLAALALACLALALPRWGRAQTPRELDRAYSLAVLLPLIASPHLHTQSLALLLVPGALAVKNACGEFVTPQRQARTIDALLLVFAGLFFLPFCAIQGVSLTVFLVLALYLWTALQWPRWEEPQWQDQSHAHSGSADPQPRARERRRRWSFPLNHHRPVTDT